MKFLKNNSVALVEQLTVKPINDVIKFLGRLNQNDIENIKECIRLQLNL
jgi:hypothetical protein